MIRLKSELSDAEVDKLNNEFSSILVKGKIEKSQALAQEATDEAVGLPRLLLHFNQKDLGRLYQMIATINQMGHPSVEDTKHPERK